LGHDDARQNPLSMATILIVDDRHTNRELLITLLGYGGHRLLEASDGVEGLAAARAERPDLIITDIVMPGMDGFEFSRQVRADPVIGDTQIIFYSSSHLAAEARRLADACGVAYVLAKPAEPETILGVVSAALDAKQIPPVRPVPGHFHNTQMRMVTNTLKKRVEELEAELAAVNQVNEQLAALYLVTQSSTQAPRWREPHLLKGYLAQVKKVAALGHEPLSPRESEVVGLVANGHTNKEIAQRLSMSVRTVERHRSSIMKKLKLRNRAELIGYAVRRELLNGARQKR